MADTFKKAHITEPQIYFIANMQKFGLKSVDDGKERFEAQRAVTGTGWFPVIISNKIWEKETSAALLHDFYLVDCGVKWGVKFGQIFGDIKNVSNTVRAKAVPAQTFTDASKAYRKIHLPIHSMVCSDVNLYNIFTPDHRANGSADSNGYIPRFIDDSLKESGITKPVLFRNNKNTMTEIQSKEKQRIVGDHNETLVEGYVGNDGSKTIYVDFAYIISGGWHETLIDWTHPRNRNEAIRLSGITFVMTTTEYGYVKFTMHNIEKSQFVLSKINPIDSHQFSKNMVIRAATENLTIMNDVEAYNYAINDYNKTSAEDEEKIIIESDDSKQNPTSATTTNEAGSESAGTAPAGKKKQRDKEEMDDEDVDLGDEPENKPPPSLQQKKVRFNLHDNEYFVYYPIPTTSSTSVVQDDVGEISPAQANVLARQIRAKFGPDVPLPPSVYYPLQQFIKNAAALKEASDDSDVEILNNKNNIQDENQNEDFDDEQAFSDIIDREVFNTPTNQNRDRMNVEESAVSTLSGAIVTDDVNLMQSPDYIQQQQQQ